MVPFSSLLCWSLISPRAQPCGARRAERLGRSVGRGQRRLTRDHGLTQGPLFHLSADGLSPRVVRRRCRGPVSSRPAAAFSLDWWHSLNYVLACSTYYEVTPRAFATNVTGCKLKCLENCLPVNCQIFL